MRIFTINSTFYFTRAGFDCYLKTFEPPITEWKRICVCNIIPRPENLSYKMNKMIFCDGCQEIFHRECINCGDAQRYYCPNCYKKNAKS
jgi:hypothetical protein